MAIAPDGTAYWLTGPADAPLLVFIHGMGLCSGIWDGMLGDFSNYQILRYDLFGHGQSAAAPTETSLSSFAGQAVDLLDHLGKPQGHFIGFSIGGMINRRIALDYPEYVQSLVILNSPHNRGAEGQAQVEARAKQTQTGGPAATVDAAIARWFTPDCLQSDHPGPTQTRDWVVSTDAQSYAQTAWVLANGVVELIDLNPPITHPSLIITSEFDERSTPQMARAIADEIAGSKLKIIPQYKHLGLIEAPHLFSQPIAEFLDSL